MKLYNKGKEFNLQYDKQMDEKVGARMNAYLKLERKSDELL